MQGLTMVAAFAVSFAASCVGSDRGRDTPSSVGPSFDTDVPGEIIVRDGPQPRGRIVARGDSLRVEVAGATEALEVQPVEGELRLVWGRTRVDPSAPLPPDAAAAIDLLELMLIDRARLEHLFGGTTIAAPYRDAIYSVCMATGCSGQVCASEPLVTTCEWRPEYACLSLSECGPHGPLWSCAWKQTPEYLACVDRAAERAADAQFR